MGRVNYQIDMAGCCKRRRIAGRLCAGGGELGNDDKPEENGGSAVHMGKELFANQRQDLRRLLSEFKPVWAYRGRLTR